jgi:hypothetical protein
MNPLTLIFIGRLNFFVHDTGGDMRFFEYAIGGDISIHDILNDPKRLPKPSNRGLRSRRRHSIFGDIAGRLV